jgi:hypothetical protein
MFSVGVLCKKLASTYTFLENQLGDSHTLHTPNFFVWFIFGIYGKIGNLGLHEYRCSESLALLKGVNEILLSFVF